MAYKCVKNKGDGETSACKEEPLTCLIIPR